MKPVTLLLVMRRATLALLLACACGSSAEAKTFTFNDTNFQCDAPDAWHVAPRDQNAVFFSQGPAPDYATVMVTCFPADPVVEVYSPLCYNTVSDNLQSHGYRIASKRLVMVNGYQAAEINCFLVRPDGSVENDSRRFIAADGYLYSVTILAVNADPTANPVLLAARDSFRFLTPPQLPRARSLGFTFFHLANTDNHPESQATAMMVAMEMSAEMLFVGAAYSPVFLLIWFGMLIYYFLRRPPRPAAPVRPPASTAETSSSSIPVNRAPAPRPRAGLLPAPRQLPRPPGK